MRLTLERSPLMRLTGAVPTQSSLGNRKGPERDQERNSS